MRADAEVLEGAAGYTFRDRGLLRRALTHRSYVHERAAAGEPGVDDNEQLEFLGDSILGFLVSESLVERCPRLTEGRLSKLKAHLVSAACLHGVAQFLRLGEHLLMGRGEDLTGGRGKKTLLADAVEALIAAIYLDGGIEAARRFVLGHVVDKPETLPENAEPPLTDFKGALQELAQARGLPQPRYTIVKERGPEHAKTFTVEARIGPEMTARGEALSKKSAAQKAAAALMQRLAAGEA